MPTRLSVGKVRRFYAFIKANSRQCASAPAACLPARPSEVPFCAGSDFRPCRSVIRRDKPSESNRTSGAGTYPSEPRDGWTGRARPLNPVASASPAKPKPSKVSVDGSGTGVTLLTPALTSIEYSLALGVDGSINI